MKHTNKTAGETASTITFKADWLDFCNYYSRYIHDTRVGCIMHKPKGGRSNA